MQNVEHNYLVFEKNEIFLNSLILFLLEWLHKMRDNCSLKKITTLCIQFNTVTLAPAILPTQHDIHFLKNSQDYNFLVKQLVNNYAPLQR